MSRRALAPLKKAMLALALVVSVITVTSEATAAQHSSTATDTGGCSTNPGTFVASIDTMKQSRDTQSDPMTTTQIDAEVTELAEFHPNFITVDTQWEYPAYMDEWVTAIRAYGGGAHVWFRFEPDNYDSGSGIAPTTYLSDETSFIEAAAADYSNMFESGDMVDANPEPDDSPWWNDNFPSGWNYSSVPNTYTDQFNAFLVNVAKTAHQALKAESITGVNTKVLSLNSWWGKQGTNVLYASTLSYFGKLYVDSYPDAGITNSTDAVTARVADMDAIESANPGVPIILAEMGYDNNGAETDSLQDSVLVAEWDAIETDPCLYGLNYWVGVGNDSIGGQYTHIITLNSDGSLTARPAASDLRDFFAYEGVGCPFAQCSG